MVIGREVGRKIGGVRSNIAILAAWKGIPVACARGAGLLLVFACIGHEAGGFRSRREPTGKDDRGKDTSWHLE